MSDITAVTEAAAAAAAASTFSIADAVAETATHSQRFLRQGEKTPNWDLSGGMEKEEYIFLAFYCLYMLIMYILYWRDVMKPMKLLAVFVHEMVSPACSLPCWLGVVG